MKVGILVAALVLAATSAASANVTIRALALPSGATIDPFGDRALMAISPDGTIAATTTLHGWQRRVVLWNATGTYRFAAATALAIAEFDANGALLANGTHPVRIDGSAVLTVDTSTCETFPQLSSGVLVAGTLADGSLVATMLSPPVVNLDDTSGQTAPVVLHLRSWQCLNMGNGVAMATAGLYTVGYTAYVDNVPAPSNVVSSKERFVAMRWHERTREPLGTGVALGVNADGEAVGASVPPGSGAQYATAPQALLWQNPGSAVALDDRAPLSVAYAVDARGRVTGMIEDDRHRHFAFLWQNGVLRVLDDAARAPGWRFECGYAFAANGAIVGIGTYRGTPSAFEISGL